jgi:hypothetical protein
MLPGARALLTVLVGWLVINRVGWLVGLKFNSARRNEPFLPRGST